MQRLKTFTYFSDGKGGQSSSLAPTWAFSVTYAQGAHIIHVR